MSTFIGIGQDFLDLHFKKTKSCLYLHRRIIKQPIENSEQEPHPKITKLAIGVDGGFNPNGDETKYQTTETNVLVVYPNMVTITLDTPGLPDIVTAAVSALLAADSVSRLEELQDLAGTWEGEKLTESKHARNLVQLNNGKKIPPKGWRCEKCDLTDNLWLNLTDGSILCGRRFFDGSGGNNHALEHYSEYQYPLAVKLGTITPNGADVYSYEEQNMVEDPYLAQHLAHFGINISQMEKSDKSMVELEIDYNQRIGEWTILTEANSILEPIYGPGFTGLTNLGNSCYLNSVVQVIFSIPEFRDYFYPPYEIFQNSPEDPSCDFNSQMAKLAYGLYSGKYSQPPVAPKQENEGIKVHMFKTLVGKNHQEFSSKRQQDAQEFLLHLINTLDRNFRIGGKSCNPTKALAFQIEDRIECTSSHKVNYTTRTEYVLPLPIAMDKMLNSAEVAAYEEKKKKIESEGKQIDPNEVVRPKVALSDCFSAFIAPEIIEDFFSTAIQGKTLAKKTSKLKTFPDFLFLQIKKFALGEDWLPKKLDVSIEVDEILDLSRLRSTGLQPDEEVLPDRQIDSGSGSSSRSSSLFTFDPSSLAQVNSIVEMGYGMDAAKRAVYTTNGAGLDAALSWLLDHQDDPDINDTFTLDQVDVPGASSSSTFEPDPEALETLKNMGLPEASAIRGLKETSNNVERAIDWIFSHTNELNQAPPLVDEAAPSISDSPVCRDGSEKYRLVAFISHMGASTLCGHYVAHILKDDKWVIFNDSKVAVSERPPKELAYLYLYARQ